MSTVEIGGQVYAIYTDLKNAFDAVNFNIYKLKLKLIGIHGPLLNWFKSYLSDREQQVKINSNLSNIIKVTSGVPQGGHLSPLLFLIFVNDLDTIFKHAKCLLFADDLKLYYSVNDGDDCIKLQEDLNRFSMWCDVNGLCINIDKCQQISFTRRNNPMKFNYTIHDVPLISVSSVKDLGVWLSQDLTFTEHLDKMYKKAIKVLGFIKRNTWEFNNPLCIKVYIVH